MLLLRPSDSRLAAGTAMRGTRLGMAGSGERVDVGHV